MRVRHARAEAEVDHAAPPPTVSAGGQSTCRMRLPSTLTRSAQAGPESQQRLRNVLLLAVLLLAVLLLAVCLCKTTLCKTTPC